jgi:PPOX class probable F420-dependent enzyme
MTPTVPATHLDLLENPIVVTLATLTPESAPHLAAVWRRWDGTHMRITSDRQVKKIRNIAVHKTVAVMALDPANPYRYLVMEGIVEQMTAEGALDELNRHTQMYMGQPRYYGAAEPVEKEASYDGVQIVIRPTHFIKIG